MRAISPKFQEKLTQESTKYGCMRAHVLKDHVCKGRLATREHVWIYAGRQIDEFWSIILLCSYAHSVDEFQDGGILDKEINEWLSLAKVLPGDLDKYPRKDWFQRKKYLEGKYGVIHI